MSSLPSVEQRPKGVVDPAAASRMFRLARYLPPAELAPFLDHYWVVEWDLRGKPAYVQRTLPYPCVNLVFDTGRTAVFGVPTGAAANSLLSACLPQPDPQVERIAAILRIAEQAPGLTQVGDLAASAGIGMRALQQLFSDYVGVSPKWVIRRYRLHEAADRLANGEEIDLSTLALNLGYFDQAHFTSDFHKLVGKPPAEYRRAAKAAGV